MKLEFKVEEKGVYVDVKIDGMSIENSSKLLDAVRDITQSQMDKKEETKMISFKEGYQSLKSDQEGLHHPKSEYEDKAESSPKDYGMKEIDGEKRYQMFYICSSCGHKGKRFIQKGTVYTSCHECGHRMNVKPATEDGIGYKDDFSNYYIAGDFQRNTRPKAIVSH